jgi:VanZ family protein
VGPDSDARRVRLEAWKGALVYWGPLAVWLVATFYVSTGAMSSENTSRFVGPLLRWLLPDLSPAALYGVHVAVRKTAHVTQYGLLALLAFRAVRGGRRPAWRTRWAVQAFLIATCYAAIDEYHQSFASNRTGTAQDVLIDVVGASAALVFLAWWRNR